MQGVDSDSRSSDIVNKIREKYSLSDEIAIIRKALMKLGIEDDQLSEYCEYVENAKVIFPKEKGSVR